MQQSYLSLAVSRGLLTMASLTVFAGDASAQSAPPEQAPSRAAAASSTTDLDAVQVTNIRESIRKSQALKQDAVGTVEAISAEDVGKFPDQNVADALQRIPGVSVDRSGGESRFVTVRGFGPEFNVVTMNGRTLATENAGREFSFDILPSEIISSAEVFKTSRADLDEGAIGANIDILTRRPLDNPGFHAAGSVSGLYDSTSEKTAPKVSAFFSNTNADNTFGYSLGAVRFRRDHITETADTRGWLSNGAGIQGVPGYDNVAIPRSMQYTVSHDERTRTSLNGALDWKPNDNLRISLDAFHSEYRIKNQQNAVGFWDDPGDILTVNGVKQVTVDPKGFATGFVRNNTGGLANDYIVAGYPRDSTSSMVGLNAAWNINDATVVDADVAWSKAKEDVGGKQYFMVMGTRNNGTNPTWSLNPGGFPSYSNLVSTIDPNDLHAHFVDREGDNTSDEIKQGRLDLTRSFNDGVLSRLKIGVQGSQRTKEIITIRTSDQDLNCNYRGYSVKVPAELAGVFNAGSMVDGKATGAPGSWVNFDPEAYFAFLSSPEAYNQFAPGGAYYDPNDPGKADRIRQALAQYGGYTATPNPRSWWQVRERSYSAYLMADFEGAWGSMDWKLNAGVRYVRTEVESKAISAQVLSIIGNPADPTNAIVQFSQPVPISREGRYHDWLPSLNFRLNLREDLVLRASVSDTLTRPTITNLRANEDISVRPPGSGSKSNGNPELRPYTSRNYDLGLDWYFTNTSYASVAAFYKDGKNYPVTVVRPVQILGYPFLETLPVNAETAKIKGVETTLQYTFDWLPGLWSGFGVQANYTWVDSAQSFDPSVSTGQFAVVGLANSGNAILFYEKEKLGFRIAYNWRDEYLSAVRGNEGEPTTVKPYGQIDLSANYNVTDKIAVFAEVNNLTGRTEGAWSRYPDRPQWIADNGRLNTVGILGSW
ncbi:MAG: Colicin I receptor [Stenotrophomonas maltophilia]|nr:MAG: Colicin I receptor [Stenotrophomonas maltophilia]